MRLTAKKHHFVKIFKSMILLNSIKKSLQLIDFLLCWDFTSKSYEPRHEKTCLWGFPPGKTQTSLLSITETS